MSRRVSCVPSTDAAFVSAAVEALATLDGQRDAGQIERMLCGLLIDRYPRVDVHRQTEFARVFEQDVWYAYRDGRPELGSRDDPD